MDLNVRLKVKKKLKKKTSCWKLWS